MSAKNKIILASIMGILFVISAALFFFPRHNYETNITKSVEVKNGTASPSSFHCTLTVNKSGEYFIISDWMDNNVPSFISGISVTDSLGNIIFCSTGGLARAESVPKKLSKGRYRFTVDILTSPEAFNSYSKQHGLDDAEVVNPVDTDFYKDCSASMKYSFYIKESGQRFALAMMIAGMIVGCLLVVIITTMARREEPSSRKYDERQLTYQGKAYKFAFLTMLIYMGLLIAVYTAGDIVGTKLLPVDNATLILIGLLISVLVFAIYAVLKDAYFRMDENKNFLFGFFFVLAVFNLLIGFFRILNGDITENGVITFVSAGNLLAGFAMLIMIIVVIVKRILEKRDAEND
jgi:hypothetical protein